MDNATKASRKIKYIFRNQKKSYNIHEDENGKKYIVKGRQKVGTIISGVDPNDPNKIVLGFSLCNKCDKWDFVKDIPVKDFGLELAWKRALKWVNFSKFEIMGNAISNLEIEEYVKETGLSELFQDSMDNLDDMLDDDDSIPDSNPDMVSIPMSVHLELKKYIISLMKYYKDKTGPVWLTDYISFVDDDIIELTDVVED